MQHPKVTIIGAGSLYFGRKAIWQMVHSPYLQSGTLALVDTDAQRLEKMRKLAELVIAHHNVPLKLEASTDRREVLADSDFVVLSFAHRNAHYRGIDVEVSARYGIRMCSGDTIGPGGVFRTAREFPEILRVAADIEDLTPNAWVINYINPTAVHGIGLKRYFPNLKSFALCDAQYPLRQRFAKAADVPNDEKLVVLTAGPNHFSWALQVEYDGVDILTPRIEQMRDQAEDDLNKQSQGGKTKAKGWLNNSIAIELYEAFGSLPTVLGHTKEYLRFYQGHNVTDHDTHPPLKLFEVPDRVEWTNNVWQRVDDYVSGAVNISEFDSEFGADPATDIIEGMWGENGQGLGKRFFINTMNGGAVSNMADDAFLELYCDVDMDGPRPLPVGEMPRGIRGICETILDTHELTAQAVHDNDRNLLRRALLSDPLTNSVGDTDALIEELLEVEREALPVDAYAREAVDRV